MLTDMNENLVEQTSIIVNLDDITIQIYFLKTLFIVVYTYITFLKIINNKKYFTIKSMTEYIFLFAISIIVTLVKTTTSSFISISMLIFLLSSIFEIFNKKGIGYTMIITLLSLAINYIMYFIAVIFAFIINDKIGKIENDWINLTLIIAIHTTILAGILKLKKFRYGISSLQRKANNQYIEIIMLNISASIVLLGMILSSRDTVIGQRIIWIFIIYAIIMFITIQKSLQLYYKQKLLVQELEQTKQELAEKTKEVEELEAENIKISKNAHTLTHKQKSLEHKIEEMMMKTEISKEEAAEVRDRLSGIAKDLYKEKTTIELDKTGIAEIDDMLKYMQSECKKNKIDFELQLKGNIHHMTNNLIAKEDLETLLADHIKNAIIAINHTDNINRSILVRLGKIEETYGLYIYDSGIEFETETLENLGKKPSTTHADEGGTGMGFMNTFDTLRKCNASLIIEEYNEPSKDNYTKALLIKFDNKNEFKIKSYRQNEK